MVLGFSSELVSCQALTRRPPGCFLSLARLAQYEEQYEEKYAEKYEENARKNMRKNIRKNRPPGCPLSLARLAQSSRFPCRIFCKGRVQKKNAAKVWSFTKLPSVWSFLGEKN